MKLEPYTLYETRNGQPVFIKGHATTIRMKNCGDGTSITEIARPDGTMQGQFLLEILAGDAKTMTWYPCGSFYSEGQSPHDLVKKINPMDSLRGIVKK